MHIVIGLILAFVLVAVFSNRKTRQCRWRADRSLDNDAGHYFRCMHCGAETRVRDVRPPQICLKPQSKAE